MRLHILDDGVDLRGKVEIFAGESTLIVRRESEFHAIVNVENFGVVVGFVGERGDAIDKRDSVVERITFDDALDLSSDMFPFGRERQSLSDISFAQFWCWQVVPLVIGRSDLIRFVLIAATKHRRVQRRQAQSRNGRPCGAGVPTGVSGRP